MLIKSVRYLTEVVKMTRTITKKKIEINEKTSKFDPFRIISDEEFEKNLNAIIAYYQMTKGETKKRFVSQYENDEDLIL